MNTVAVIAAILIGVVVVADIIFAVIAGIRDARREENPSIPDEAITWSQLLRESYGITTFFAWGIAVWVGRWFSPLERPLVKWYVGLAIVAALTCVVVLLGYLLWRKYQRPILPPIVIVSLGLVAGWLLLPLSPAL